MASSLRLPLGAGERGAINWVTALILVALQPAWWPALVLTCVLRGLIADAVAQRVLGGQVDWLWLIPQDLLSFLFWIAGFFGNRIRWRGRTYRLLADGRFELLG